MMERAADVLTTRQEQAPFGGEGTAPAVNGVAIQVRDLVKRYHKAQ